MKLNLSNRRQALILIGEKDFESHLIAIRDLLRRNRKAEAATARKIKKLAKQLRAAGGRDPEEAMHLGDYYADEAYLSGVQDAAHSMAAVGMLAPLVESLFVSIFGGLRKLNRDKALSSSENPRLAASQDQFWDPRFKIKSKSNRRDIVAGIRQLASAIGLSEHLPPDYDKTLAALFQYRNMMFHNGFEWLKDEGIGIKDRIQSSGWPDEWFKESKGLGDTRFFYMTPEFVQHCLDAIDQMIDGVGAYVNGLLRSRENPKE
ncbi:MAG: hypothetical protein OXG29_10480 [Gammaproteobacteria bacterium]|nr:hypothetical protein [Gammaproteobacteria bacterium]